MSTGDTPQTHDTPSEGSVRGECTLTERTVGEAAAFKAVLAYINNGWKAE